MVCSLASVVQKAPAKRLRSLKGLLIFICVFPVPLGWGISIPKGDGLSNNHMNPVGKTTGACGPGGSCALLGSCWDWSVPAMKGR